MRFIRNILKKSPLVVKIIKKILNFRHNSKIDNSLINKLEESSTELSDLPIQFSSEIYSSYIDLKDMNEDNLYNHYINYGEKEGRVSNAIPNRLAFLKLLSNKNKTILEIGPFTTPSISGSNVKYFDLMNIDELRKRAKRHNHHIGNINKIDFISPTGDLSVIKQKFDYVLSSHCVEHQPDLISHLQKISKILIKEGYYFLIIPDKRYCFDALLPNTSISKIVECYLEKRTIHSPSSIIEHRALTTHNDVGRHWKGDHKSEHDLVSRVQLALNEIKKNPNTYIDVHSLQFTPTSFCEVIDLLFNLKFIKLSVERCYPTVINSNEFFVILKNQQ